MQICVTGQRKSEPPNGDSTVKNEDGTYTYTVYSPVNMK